MLLLPIFLRGSGTGLFKLSQYCGFYDAPLLSVTVMPKGCESRWQVGTVQQMMHLYFDEQYLKQLALTTFDIDPRTLNLPELTFLKAPVLRQ
jgi:hypothetical protein